MDKLISLLAEIFINKMDKGEDGYFLLKLSVPCKLLYELYERLSKVDVPPIETLMEDEKLKFWGIGKRYYESELEAVKASKAAYMISLISNIND